jgi:flagellar hook-basal body complex protein FliE
MATRARFGRLPRSAPSLTSTIVALAQEYQRIRDRNIEDAWKEGGLFEGKKVTDQMMIKYWKERRDSVDPSDPNWDYYNNLLHGYEFNIAESTEYLKYKEGKIGEAAMAAFYRKWAAKMPRNSANWRSLMTKAAEFKAAAARGRSGSSAQARENAYWAQQQRTYDGHEAAWDYLSGTIMNAAIANNVVNKNDARSGGAAEYGWGAIKDPSFVSTFIYRLNTDPALAGTKAEMLAELDRLDPGGGWKNKATITQGDLDRLATRKQQGVKARRKLARKTGHSTSDIDADDEAADDAALVISTADFQSTLERKKRDFYEVMDDPTATFEEKKEAADQFKGWLDGKGRDQLMRSIPDGALDPANHKKFDPDAAALVGRFNATSAVLGGDTTQDLTLMDDPFAASTGSAGENSFVSRYGTQIDANAKAVEALKSGKEVLVRDDKEGGWKTQFADDPELEGKGAIVPNPNGVGGMFVPFKPMKAAVFASLDPNTGAGLGPVDLKSKGRTNLNTGEGGKTAEDDDLGYVLDYPKSDGSNGRLFGVWVGGEMRWTWADPTGGNLRPDGKGGFTVAAYGPDAVKAGTKGLIDRATVSAKSENGAYVASASSPLTAAMQSDKNEARRLGYMSPEDIARQEAPYFRAHPTQQMMKDRQAGATFEQALANEVQRSVNTQQSVRMWGPAGDAGERARIRDAMQSKADAELAARLAAQADRDAPIRQQLVRDMDAWQADLFKTTGASGYGETKPAGMMYGRGGYMPNPAVAKYGAKDLASLPNGNQWNLKDLLTSPTISTEQAKAIASYLSGGAVSGSGPYMTYAQRTPQPGQTFIGQKRTPPATAPVIPVKPKEEPKPKTKPKETEKTGGVKAGGTTTVNPYTGFATPTSGPAAGPNAANPAQTDVNYLRRKYGVPY